MVDAIEYNEVNIVGVRPAISMDSIQQYPRRPAAGTQVTKFDSISNDTDYFYQITAGKTLYLLNMSTCAISKAGATGTAYIIITNASKVAQYYPLSISPLALSTIILPFVFPVPIEIPSGYYIAHGTSDPLISIFTFISGYEM